MKRLLLALLFLPVTMFGVPTVTDRGTGGNYTGGGVSSIACSPSGTMAAGSTGVLFLSIDNAGTSGTIGITPAGPITDTAGNIWYRMASGGHDPAGVNAGIEVASYYSILTTQLTSGGSVTITFTASPPARSYAMLELVPGTAGNLVMYRSSGFTAGSSTGTPSNSILQPFCLLGNIVLGFGGAKGSAGAADTWAGDATNNTPNAWSTFQHGGIGTTTTGVAVMSQYKVLTANSASSQTFAPTLTAASCVVGNATFQETGPNFRGGGQTAAGATSTVASPGLVLAQNTFGVLVVSSDNGGASGTTLVWPTPTVTDSVGNTWTLQQDVIGGGSSVLLNSGVEQAIYTSSMTVAALTPNDNVTLSHIAAASVANRYWFFYSFSPGATLSFSAVGNSGSQNATTTPTVTTSSIPTGDIVLAAASMEQTNTWVGDTDTSNGTWTSAATTGTGAGSTGGCLIAQVKTVTGTGTQTYNPTITTSGDGIIGWLQIHSSTGPTAAQKAAFFQLFP